MLRHHPDDVAGERQELAGHGLLEAVHARNAVADFDDAADLLEIDLRLVARELALDDFADLSGVDHRSPLGAGQPVTHALELRVEAAVQDHAADLGHEAAQQL